MAPSPLAALEEVLAAGGAVACFDRLADLTGPDAGHDRIAHGLAAAKAAYAQGFRRVAIAAVREAWRRAPTRAEAAFRLCAWLVASRDAEAKTVLDQCLAQFPQQAEGWVEVGEALLAAQQKRAALVCFARGVPSAALSIRQGLLARDLGRRKEARASFDDAVRLDPTSVRAWFLLGTAAEDVRDLEAAKGAYRQALALDPTLAEAAVNLGIVLQETGDLAGAKAAYRQAVSRRPDSFGRVAQALATAPRGELWLDLGRLRRDLGG